MATQQNDSLAPGFHLFPSLPSELRLRVWRAALERNRIIRVFVASHLDLDAEGAGDDDAELECRSHGAMPPHLIRSVTRIYGSEIHYAVVADGYDLVHPLLSVNTEARDVALRFYRVRMPCIFGGNASKKWADSLCAVALPPPGKEWSHGTLYMNPEFDFLLRLGSGETYRRDLDGKEDVTIDFIQRFKTVYDPSGVGLLNLVVNMEALESFKGVLKRSCLDPAATGAFRETFAQLRQVWFLDLCPTGHGYGHTTLSRPGTSPFFSYSYPMMVSTPNFDRLPRDPRAIDLTKVPSFRNRTGPETFLPQWKRLMDAWGVSGGGQAGTTTDFRLMLAADSRPFGQAYDQAGALQCLGTERRRFDAAVGERDDVMVDMVNPVFGFWLFPAAPLPLGIGQPAAWVQLVTMDMSASWPELGLFSFPEGDV